MSAPPRHSVPPAPPADALVRAALAEDLGVEPEVLARGSVIPDLLRRDVTTSATIPAETALSGRIVARQTGVVAGLPYAARSWEILAEAAGMPGATRVRIVTPEGSRIEPGDVLAEVAGPAGVVLAGERTALDFLMVLSGIATEAARWQHAAGPRMAVTDTRKTVPGLRELSKYAVAAGGAHNHRAGLWDMVLVKDNHLRAAGGVTAAVAAARAASPDLALEVEADTVEQAVEAASAGADLVLLDNMDDDMLTRAVAAVRAGCATAGTSCATEASGTITFERLPALAATGVDRVSTSRLTMAAPLDIGLDAD